MAVWLVEPEEQMRLALKFGLRARDAQDWYVKWRGVVRNAKYRGIECTLTLEQYMRLATKAKLTRPSQIGMAVEQFNLARKGDVGGYVYGNCRFITSKQNRRERVTNGCFDMMALRMLGQTKETSEHFAKISAARKGRSAATHEDVARAVEKVSKSFRLRSPTGKVFKGHNLSKFCRGRGLPLSSMAAICKSGGTRSINGWTGKYL